MEGLGTCSLDAIKKNTSIGLVQKWEGKRLLDVGWHQNAF
jgi:hypothetical protein